jgi:hypothetical protein
MAGLGRVPLTAAEGGNDNRGSFRDSDEIAADAERGLPTRGEFTVSILTHLKKVPEDAGGNRYARCTTRSRSIHHPVASSDYTKTVPKTYTRAFVGRLPIERHQLNALMELHLAFSTTWRPTCTENAI